MSLVGTKNINSASTEEKIRTLARTRPAMGAYLNELFQSNATEGLSAQDTKELGLDRYTRNVVQTLFSVEIKSQNAAASTLTPIATGIDNFTTEVTHEIQGVQENLNKLLTPVSSATGQTLGTLTNMARNPLGAPFILANSLTALVDKVNPGFANKLDATFKKYKVDELANMPGQVIGSIRNLAMAADAILSVPFAIASDIYNGLMDIMKEMSELVDSLISSVFNFFFGPKGVLDSIVPISAIMEFLEALGELADFINVVGGITGGFDNVLSIVNQVTTITSQVESTLRNPVSLAEQYLPPEVGETLGMIRNPDKLLSNMIPPSVKSQMQEISKIPGLGFVGNLGYSIGGSLETLSQGVIGLALQQYQSQIDVIAPFLNRAMEKKPVIDLQEEQPQEIKAASTNPNIATVQGVPVQQTPRKPLLNAKTNETPPQTKTSPEVTVTMPDNMKFNANTPLVVNGISITQPSTPSTVDPNITVTIPDSLRSL
jgi:hypothetical protein